MNKVIKKAVSVLLIVFMVFGSAPLTGFMGLELPGFNFLSSEAEAATYEGTCGDNLTWKLNTTIGELVISGTGNMTNWSDVYDIPWRDCRSSIKSVTIEDGVESICDHAFFDCINLVKVTMSNGVTVIGRDAFNNCYNLVSITIPEGITSIGSSAFLACSSLSEAYYPGTFEQWEKVAVDSDNSELTQKLIYECDSEASYYAGYCGENLIWKLYNNGELVISGMGNMTDWSEVYDIPWHDCCLSIKTVIIEDGVESVGDYAFFGCTNLSSIKIPDGITSIGRNAFYDTAIYNNSAMWENNYAFYIGNCLVDTKYYSEMYGYSIKDGTKVVADYAFMSYLTGTITIPDSVISIGDNAFRYCENLKIVDYSGDEVEWNNIIIGEGNEPLLNATIRCATGAIGVCGANLTWKFNAETGELVINGTGNMTNWSNSSVVPWYSIKDKIKTVTIEEGITSIGDYAFYSCSNIETAHYVGTVEQWANITVKLGNEYLTRKLVFECNSDKPYHGGTCGENLTWKLYTNGELVISGTGDMNNYTKYIMNDISLCGVPWYSVKDKIKTVTIGDDITSIGDFAFVDCINLKGIAIPDTITSIGRNAFSGCSSLTSIAIPDRVTNIGSYAFSGCSSLTSISIPDSVTSIGTHAFEYCSKLQSIVIPDGITRIEDYTFQYCYGLKNVTIPVSVTNIGYWAFAACVGIESANYAGSSERWKNVTVGSENYELTNKLIFECNSERPYYGAGDCGENLTWKLYTDGELVISGTGNMTDWIWEEWLSNTNAPWAKKKLKIKTVTIENGVTNIGDYAFSSCNSITQVTIPENIQSINSNAFSDCTNLEKIEILGYSVEIADNAFSNSPNVVLYCKSGSTVQSYAELNNIMYVLLDGPTADFAVKNNQLVAYKGNSANPKIPSGVTSIGANAFKGNETITKLELPASVTSIFSGAFSNCSALEEIFIPHTVTTIAADTFDGTNAKIVCYANSTAHQFAVDNGIDFELVKVILNETALVLKVGEYSIITATPEQEYISSAEMSWKSSDTSVATVDENGKVTAKNNGAVIISAIAPNGATLATCSVNVIPNEYKVSWIVEGNTTTQTYEVGEAITAPANPSKSGYKFVGWTPSVPPRMPAYNLMFTAVFEASSPVKADVINPPTQTTISYGDAIILHVDESKVPAGGRVEWAADNGNFSCSANGLECKIKPEKSGSTTITATIYDANGNAVSYDNQEMTSKAGFFDKLVAFFKGLFGLTKTIER